MCHRALHTWCSINTCWVDVSNSCSEQSQKNPGLYKMITRDEFCFTNVSFDKTIPNEIPLANLLLWEHFKGSFKSLSFKCTSPLDWTGSLGYWNYPHPEALWDGLSQFALWLVYHHSLSTTFSMCFLSSLYGPGILIAGNHPWTNPTQILCPHGAYTGVVLREKTMNQMKTPAVGGWYLLWALQGDPVPHLSCSTFWPLEMLPTSLEGCMCPPHLSLLQWGFIWCAWALQPDGSESASQLCLSGEVISLSSELQLPNLKARNNCSIYLIVLVLRTPWADPRQEHGTRPSTSWGKCEAGCGGDCNCCAVLGVFK